MKPVALRRGEFAVTRSEATSSSYWCLCHEYERQASAESPNLFAVQEANGQTVVGPTQVVHEPLEMAGFNDLLFHLTGNKVTMAPEFSQPRAAWRLECSASRAR